MLDYYFANIVSILLHTDTALL